MRVRSGADSGERDAGGRQVWRSRGFWAAVDAESRAPDAADLALFLSGGGAARGGGLSLEHERALWLRLRTSIAPDPDPDP